MSDQLAQTRISDFKALHVSALELLQKMDAFMDGSPVHPIEVISYISRCADSLKSFTNFTRSFPLNNFEGDACRHPVQSPDVVGQGGTTKTDLWICPRCGSKTGVPLPKFVSCSECYGTNTPYPTDAPGQGGN